jgi:hypothetical protein
MNKETLEEAAKKYATNHGMMAYMSTEKKESFKKGAKWQQERSYSEKDMKEAYFSGIESTGEGWNGEYAEGNNPNIEDKFSEGFKEWFEKFKKK